MLKELDMPVCQWATCPKEDHAISFATDQSECMHRVYNRETAIYECHSPDHYMRKEM